MGDFPWIQKENGEMTKFITMKYKMHNAVFIKYAYSELSLTLSRKQYLFISLKNIRDCILIKNVSHSPKVMYGSYFFFESEWEATRIPNSSAIILRVSFNPVFVKNTFLKSRIMKASIEDFSSAMMKWENGVRLRNLNLKYNSKLLKCKRIRR